MSGTGFEPVSFPCPAPQAGGVNRAVPSTLTLPAGIERARLLQLTGFPALLFQDRALTIRVMVALFLNRLEFPDS